jgi:hypothetical protein
VRARCEGEAADEPDWSQCSRTPVGSQMRVVSTCDRGVNLTFFCLGVWQLRVQPFDDPAVWTRRDGDPFAAMARRWGTSAAPAAASEEATRLWCQWLGAACREAPGEAVIRGRSRCISLAHRRGCGSGRRVRPGTQPHPAAIPVADVRPASRCQDSRKPPGPHRQGPAATLATRHSTNSRPARGPLLPLGRVPLWPRGLVRRGPRPQR